MTDGLIPLKQFLHPRFWPTWLGIGLLRLIVMLPHGARLAVGRGLGRLVRGLLGSRRRIVRRNLELCFPELDDPEREALESRHFESLGMGVIEVGIATWAPQQEIDAMSSIEGLEHLQAALAGGKGVMMWSGHFAITEISGRILGPHMPPMAAMYRPSKNPLNDQLMRRARGISTAALITKSEVRGLLRALKANQPVWYAADQAYNRKGTVLVPFFGEPATTNTSVSQIAKVSGAPVVPFFPQRLNNGSHYRLRFLPPLEEFPSGDAEADAARLNQLLEDAIRDVPEQYYWVHRRFKGRPEGYPDPYTD